MYYDGTKLLSQLDINGNKPEIYICTTNRTGGKTTYFNRYVVKKFLNTKEKFALLYRYNYELDNVAEKFFEDIRTLFFEDYIMSSERRANGIYHELFIQKKTEKMKWSCGYAITLNSADQIKKNSHLFSSVERILFDEFQSETNHYCADEVRKFISVHTSIARGGGKQVRYVPVYMIGNPVSLINPYYIELGISERLRNDCKFLKGDGFVLEQGYIDSASQAQKSSGFNKAFSNNIYTQYSADNLYLNDNQAFIEQPSGRSIYLCTVRYQNKDYAIREYLQDGLIYCDDRPDTSFKNKIAITTDDHNINYVMLKNNDYLISQLRFFFDKGCFRFKNLKCKEVILKMLSY